jgi:GntR family transcriptional regulator, arabinose operon transcriptional repressor
MATMQWKNIAEAIRTDIANGVYVPGQKLPGEAEIAESWGVSRPTAHRAVAELQRQGYVTRQRRWGTVVADRDSHSTHMVGLIFDRFARAVDFPQSDTIRAIQEVLGDAYSLVWCDSKDDPHREAQFLRKMAGETDGIICHPISDPHNTRFLRELHDSGKPIVLLDRVPDGYLGSAVLSDDVEVTGRAVNLLLDRGHERIAFFGFHKPTVSNVRERHSAYCKALMERGIACTGTYERWFGKELETDGDLMAQAAYDAMFTLLNDKNPVTAIYCIQDCIAAGVLEACERLGVEIPRDLELATVNEWPSEMLSRPWDIHRIVRAKHEIGFQAATRLQALIAGETVDSAVLRVQADLVVADPDAIPVVFGGLRSATGFAYRPNGG